MVGPNGGSQNPLFGTKWLIQIFLWPKNGFLRHYCPTMVILPESNFVLSLEFVQTYYYNVTLRGISRLLFLKV